MKRLIKKLIVSLLAWCEKRNKVYYITGGPKGKDVYLVRYILWKSRLGCIYIHRFMRSDADYPHDHPWNFFTYIVSGGYTEYFYNTDKPVKLKTKYKSYWTESKNIRKAGSLAYRKATDIHKVKLKREYTMDEIEQAPLTICFMGPRKRHWGFWPNSATWVDWREYLNMKPNDVRIEGSE